MDEKEWMLIEVSVPPDEGLAILELLHSSSFAEAEETFPKFWMQQDGSMLRWRPVPSLRKAPSGE